MTEMLFVVVALVGDWLITHFIHLTDEGDGAEKVMGILIIQGRCFII